MVKTFQFDRLITRKIVNFPAVAEYRLRGERLGGIVLPDPDSSGPVGGRSAKRGLELLILVTALGALGLHDVEIDDSGDPNKPPDFRLNVDGKEVDAEVTQLRSGTITASDKHIRKFEQLVKEQFSNDAELQELYAGRYVSVQFVRRDISGNKFDDLAAHLLKLLRSRANTNSFSIGPGDLPAFVHVHLLQGAHKQHPMLIVSAPLPPYNEDSDIDALRLLNKKRIEALGYFRHNVPVWLVVGITANYGQLEVTASDVLARITETRPFARIVVSDNFHALSAYPVELDSQYTLAQNDVAGRVFHEAGHATAALILGIPLTLTTIERDTGSERGFTGIAPDAPLNPEVDAAFTAAGIAAQTRSGCSHPEVARLAGQDDRFILEDEIAKRAGLVDFGERYNFAERAILQATALISSEWPVVCGIARELATFGTLSGRQCEEIRRKIKSH